MFSSSVLAGWDYFIVMLENATHHFLDATIFVRVFCGNNMTRRVITGQRSVIKLKVGEHEDGVLGLWSMNCVICVYPADTLDKNIGALHMRPL